MANEIKGIFDYIREGVDRVNFATNPIGEAYKKFLELPPELRQGLISQDFRQEVENLKDPDYNEQVDGFQGIAGHQQIGGQDMISGTDPTDYGVAGGENRSALGNYGNRALLGMGDVMTQPDVLGKELVDVGHGLIQKTQGIEGTEQVAKAEGLIDSIKNFDFWKSLYQGGGALDLTLGGMAVAPRVVNTLKSLPADKLKGLPAGMSVVDISKEAPTNEGYFMRSTDVLLNDPKFAGKEAIAPQSLITVKKDGDVAGELRNSGVSVQEMKEIGLIDFIQQKQAEGVKKIPKQELIDFIEENKPTVAPKYVSVYDEDDFGQAFDEAWMQGVDIYNSDNNIRFYTDNDIQELRPSRRFYSGYYDGMEVRARNTAPVWKEQFVRQKVREQEITPLSDNVSYSENNIRTTNNNKAKAEVNGDLYQFQSWVLNKYNNQDIRPEGGNPYFVRVNPDDPNDRRVDWNPEFRNQAVENGGLWSPENVNELDKIVPQASDDLAEYLDFLYKKEGKEYDWKMGNYIIRGKPSGDKELYKLMEDGELHYIDKYTDVESLEGAIKSRMMDEQGIKAPLYASYTAGGKSSGYEEIPVVVDKKGFNSFESVGLTDKDAYGIGGLHPLNSDSPYLFHLRSSVRKDLSGNKFYYIEELQSDWHQKGRKRGFQDSKKVTEAYEALKDPDFAHKRRVFFAKNQGVLDREAYIENGMPPMARAYLNGDYLDEGMGQLINFFNLRQLGRRGMVDDVPSTYNTDRIYEAFMDNSSDLSKEWQKAVNFDKYKNKEGLRDWEKVPFDKILKHADKLPEPIKKEVLRFNKEILDDPLTASKIDEAKLEFKALNEAKKDREPWMIYGKAEDIVDDAYPTDTPPFAKELWSKVGLRQGLTRAIDKGLDKMAWTNADIQTKIYDPRYLELYTNTYEKNMPRQARELLKELGVDPDKHLKKTKFDMGREFGEQEVWYIDITPELKSKLIDMKGNVRQPLYSSIGGAGIGGGLLATDPSNSDNINPNKGLLA